MVSNPGKVTDLGRFSILLAISPPNFRGESQRAERAIRSQLFILDDSYYLLGINFTMLIAIPLLLFRAMLVCKRRLFITVILSRP